MHAKLHARIHNKSAGDEIGAERERGVGWARDSAKTERVWAVCGRCKNSYEKTHHEDWMNVSELKWSRYNHTFKYSMRPNTRSDGCRKSNSPYQGCWLRNAMSRYRAWSAPRWACVSTVPNEMWWLKSWFWVVGEAEARDEGCAETEHRGWAVRIRNVDFTRSSILWLPAVCTRRSPVYIGNHRTTIVHCFGICLFISVISTDIIEIALQFRVRDPASNSWTPSRDPLVNLWYQTLQDPVTSQGLSWLSAQARWRGTIWLWSRISQLVMDGGGEIIAMVSRDAPLFSYMHTYHSCAGGRHLGRDSHCLKTCISLVYESQHEFSISACVPRSSNTSVNIGPSFFV